MKKYIIITLLLPVIALCQVSENYTLQSSAFTMSGGSAVSTNYTVMSAAGQSSPVGLLTSANYLLEAGFLRSAAETTPDAVDDIIDIPEQFRLDNNFPNPFNPTTTLQFHLPQSEVVTIEIYNLMGNKVKTIVNNRYDAGVHQVIMDATQLSSGTYFYTIRAGQNFATGKCLLLK